MLFCTGENVVRGYYIYVCYMSVYVRSVHAPLITESLLWYIVSGRIYFSTGCFQMMITQFDIQIFLSQLMEVFDSVYNTSFGKIIIILRYHTRRNHGIGRTKFRRLNNCQPSFEITCIDWVLFFMQCASSRKCTWAQNYVNTERN